MSDLEDAQDPWSVENVIKAQFVVSMRIYDVLMLLLTEENPVAAKGLNEAHAQGIIIGSLPSLAQEPE